MNSILIAIILIVLLIFVRPLIKNNRGLALLLIPLALALVYFSRYSPAQLEKKYAKAESQLNGTQDDRFYNLNDAAKAAFKTKKFELAEKYANELLTLAPAYSKNWNYGNAIHDGNMVLGELALLSGNKEEAKNYLLKAGQTPGSPQLDSFGPDMSLARDLLKTGEKSTVLQYFDLCARFWKMGGWKLKGWRLSVEKGLPVYFGSQAKI